MIEQRDLALLIHQNEQDREHCRTWWREACNEAKLAVFMAIVQPQENPVMEIVSRFAQLAFAEMCEQETVRQLEQESKDNG